MVSVAEFGSKRGDRSEITVGNNTAGTVFLRGCNPFILERKEGDVWKERHRARCTVEGDAVRILQGESRDFELAPMSPNDYVGRYRVKVQYWHSCDAEFDRRPVSEMECDGGGVAYSREFVVGAE